MPKLAAALAALSLSGCALVVGDPFRKRDPVVQVVSVQPEQAGDLGLRNFSWQCVSAAEQTCLTLAGNEAAFPKRVALGARFRLGGDEHAVVAYAGKRFVRDLGDALEAETAGTVAFYTSESGRLADFIHLRIVAATKLQLAVDPTVAFSTSMVRGATQTAAIVPMADDLPLAGTLAVHWESSDAAVLAVVDGPADAPSKKLQAVAAGTAKLTVTSGAAVVEYTITVTEPTP